MKKRKCPDPRCVGELIEMYQPIDTQMGPPIVEKQIRIVPHKNKIYQAVRCGKCGISFEVPITEAELLGHEEDDEQENGTT